MESVHLTDSTRSTSVLPRFLLKVSIFGEYFPTR
jgi:hypothetical protein